MYFIPKLPVRELQNFCVVSEVFSKEEIEKILDLEELEKFSKAAVGSMQMPTVNEQVRDSDIMWIHPNEHSAWIFEKFADLTSKVNLDFFMRDIEGIDSFQYTVYNEDGFYNWHIDAFNHLIPLERKISASILLSDPSEFEGGNFEIVLTGNINESETIPLKMGDVVFFDSKCPHRVTPVTNGTRKSLVAWVLGKRDFYV